MTNPQVKKSSQTPSSAEAVTGSRLAMTNARRHLRAAEALGDASLFGAAVAHLVLAVEESAKAWILGLLAYGIDLPDDMLVSILRHHNARHAVTFGYVFRGILILMADRAAKRVQKRHKVKGFPPELREEWSNQLLRDTQSLVGRSARSEPLLQALEWASSGSGRKNKGFYVDYVNGKWTHPGQATERQFASGLVMTRALLKGQAKWLRLMLRSGAGLDAATARRVREQFGSLKGASLEAALSNIVMITLGGSAG